MNCRACGVSRAAQPRRALPVPSASAIDLYPRPRSRAQSPEGGDRAGLFYYQGDRTTIGGVSTARPRGYHITHAN